MEPEDRRVKRFYTVNVTEVTPARQVTVDEVARGSKGYGQIRLDDPIGVHRGGFKLGDYLPKKGTILICGQETSVDEQGQEWGMPIMESVFAYDPSARKEVFRGLSLSPKFQEYLKDKDFISGFIGFNKLELLSMFRDFNTGRKFTVVGNSLKSPHEIGYSGIRGFFGFEPGILVLPHGGHYPYEVYHGRSGQLLNSTMVKDSGSSGSIEVSS